MKRNLLLIAVLVLIINATYLYSTLYILKDPNIDVIWSNSLIEKKEKIIASDKEDKIIVSAGSSGLYGIRTKDITEALGVPTYNLSTHAGLGIHFLLEETKKVAKSGDFVILPLEFTLFNTSDYNTLLSLRYYQLYDREKLNDFNLVETFKLSFTRDFFTSTNLIMKSLLNKDTFTAIDSDLITNEHGDHINHVGNLGFASQPLPIIEPFKETLGLQLIREFKEWCDENNITMYLTYSVTEFLDIYSNEKYTSYFQSLEQYFNNHEITTLESPFEVFYDAKYFYDTPYHLNEEGMSIRTEKLLEKLTSLEEFK